MLKINDLDLRQIGWLMLSAVIFIVDQISKAKAYDYLTQHDGFLEITSWFNFTLVFNDGAAFSFLRGAGGWQRIFFIVFTILVVFGLFIWLLQQHTHRLQRCAIAMIIGGALGNLIDRIRLGHVIDFIHWHYHALSWPIFNIADSAISVGIAFLIFHAIVLEKEE